MGFTVLEMWFTDFGLCVPACVCVKEGVVGLIVHCFGRAGIIWEEVLMVRLFLPTRQLCGWRRTRDLLKS